MYKKFVVSCAKLFTIYPWYLWQVIDKIVNFSGFKTGGILPIYREVLELCCNVLEKLLDASGPVTVFQRYREEILKGLSHPQITVKCLCLRQVSFSSSGTASFFLFTLIFYID